MIGGNDSFAYLQPHPRQRIRLFHIPLFFVEYVVLLRTRLYIYIRQAHAASQTRRCRFTPTTPMSSWLTVAPITQLERCLLANEICLRIEVGYVRSMVNNGSSNIFIDIVSCRGFEEVSNLTVCRAITSWLLRGKKRPRFRNFYICSRHTVSCRHDKLLIKASRYRGNLFTSGGFLRIIPDESKTKEKNNNNSSRRYYCCRNSTSNNVF